MRQRYIRILPLILFLLLMVFISVHENLWALGGGGIEGPGVPSAAGHNLSILTSDNKTWKASTYTIPNPGGVQGYCLISDNTTWRACPCTGCP
jgi:hypothetical protein